MKKLICVLLILASLAAILVACGDETFTCDVCKKEKTGKKHTEEIAGKEVVYCSDCVKAIGEEIGDIKDELEDLGDLFK